MTPKEKAQELVAKYFQLNYDWDNVTQNEWAKEAALIAIDEILNAFPHTYDLEKEYLNGEESVSVIRNIKSNINYWQEVKQEINKL